MGEEQDWVLADPAKRELENVDSDARDRIIDELDEMVDDEWGDPPDHLEPLEGAALHELRTLRVASLLQTRSLRELHPLLRPLDTPRESPGPNGIAVAPTRSSSARPRRL